MNNINQILEFIFKNKKIEHNFKFEKFDYLNLQKISKEHNLKIKKINKKYFSSIDNNNLPALITYKNKNYLLINIDKKNNHLIVKDFNEKEKEDAQKVKWIPKEIYLFLENDEDEIFKFEDDWIKEIIKEETTSYLKIFYISIFINIFVLIIPFYMMSIYDRIIPLEGVETLYTLTIGVTIILIFDLIFKYVRNYIMQDISFNINNKIEDILLSKLIKIKSNHDKYSTGNKFNLFKEIRVLKDFFSTQTMVMFLEIPFFLMGITLIWLLSENLIYVPIFISILMFMLNYIAQYKIDKKYNNLYKKEGLKSDFIFETINNKNEIVNKNLIKNKIYESYRISEEEESISKEISLIKTNTTNQFQFLIQLNNILIIFFGVFEIFNNEMTIGYLIALTILSSRVMMPIMNLNMNYLKYNDVKKSFKVLNNFLKLPEISNEQKLKIKKLEGNFKLSNVTFHYNKKYIFENLNFEIKYKDKIGIIGENSSGKSTLFDLILNKKNISKGEVLLDGHNIKNLDHSFIEKIGVLENKTYIFKGSLLKNIDIHNIFNEDTLIEKIKELKLDFLLGDNKDILGTIIEENGENISNSEKQVINLLRVFIYEPEILILDEPTNNLDTNRERNLKNFLYNYSKNRTLILFTNKLHLLEITKIVSVISNKKISEPITIQEFAKGIKK